MPVGGLVPPNPLPCLWVFEHCRANHTRFQATFPFPFKIYTCLPTGPLHLLLLLGPEDCLPRKPQSLAIVPYIHNLLLHEMLSYLRIYVLEDPAIVCDGRLTSRSRRLSTEKPDLHRPNSVKRIFIMPEEFLFRGIKDR